MFWDSLPVVAPLSLGAAGGVAFYLIFNVYADIDQNKQIKVPAEVIESHPEPNHP